MKTLTITKEQYRNIGVKNGNKLFQNHTRCYQNHARVLLKIYDIKKIAEN